MFIFLNEKPHAGCITNNPISSSPSTEKNPDEKATMKMGKHLHKTGKIK
jgi:hypothetical protein